MIGRIRTGCTCWRRDKKLVIPAKGPSTKRVIRLCRRSRAAIRRRGRGLLDRFRRTIEDGQQHERNGRDKARAGGLLCSVPSATSCLSAPPLQYSIPHKIPCNLSRRFPLYGVEAGGLPLRAARRKQENRATKP